MTRGIVLVAVLASATARADVVDSATDGFSVRSTITIDAPAHTTWVGILEIGHWWDKDHTYSHDATNLTIEPRAGGCFCEKLSADGSVRHATVIYVEPDHVLRMSGGLGPLQDMAVTGVLTFKLTETNHKTTIELTYKVGGYAPGGLAGLAKPVDGVLAAQLARLKKHVEP